MFDHPAAQHAAYATAQTAAPAVPADGKADHVLRIAPAKIELAPGHAISTLAYDGQFPGPMLRLHEGRRVVVDIHNDSDAPQVVHWHGLHLPAHREDAEAVVTEYNARLSAGGVVRLQTTAEVSFTD